MIFFKELVAFIVKERWEYDFPITRETSLQEDLKIYGDDADEFIVAFGTAFNVDVNEFRIGDYFNDEMGIIESLFNKKKCKPFTVGHLEKAIIARVLNESVINE